MVRNININEQITLNNVYNDVNCAFISYEKGEKGDIFCRLYNPIWIIRWLIVVLLFSIFHKEKRTINLLTFFIHVIFLIFHIFCAFIYKTHHSVSIQVVMTLEEFSICLMYLMSSIFSFDDVKDQESQMSKAGVWIVAIILFFSFFIAILCDLALLIIGTFLGVSEVNFPKELTDFENL